MRVSKPFLGKLAISAAALGLIVTHLVWPKLKVDAVTLGLFAVLVLPWLSFLFKSVEFPGGLRVEYQDVQRAGEKVAGVESAGVQGQPSPRPSYLEISDRDPNLALVGLRIEIETRLRALAERFGVRDSRSIGRIADELRRGHVLNDASVSGLQELIMAGNQAAHGAWVEPQAAQWALDYGPRVLAALDAKLQEPPATERGVPADERAGVKIQPPATITVRSLG